MLMRTLFDRRSWFGHSHFGPALGPHLLRLPITAPIAVIDTGDFPYINRADLFLLSRCKFYFKRELPPDHWRLFTKTVHRELPTRRFRQGRLRDAHRQAAPDLARPARDRHRSAATTSTRRRTSSMPAASRAPRPSARAGMSEIVALRERGLRIDIPEGRLPPQEFYRRCAQAWIVWSPEGLGWDCFRHYEALGCGSVPLINQPTIERHRPLINGVHALYYDPEPGFLTQAIEAALADKDRLRAIARDGKAHVMAHHTMTAIAQLRGRDHAGRARLERRVKACQYSHSRAHQIDDADREDDEARPLPEAVVGHALDDVGREHGAADRQRHRADRRDQLQRPPTPVSDTK